MAMTQSQSYHQCGNKGEKIHQTKPCMPPVCLFWPSLVTQPDPQPQKKKKCHKASNQSCWKHLCNKHPAANSLHASASIACALLIIISSVALASLTIILNPCSVVRIIMNAVIKCNIGALEKRRWFTSHFTDTYRRSQTLPSTQTEKICFAANVTTLVQTAHHGDMSLNTRVKSAA